jgi:uncharacterized membrane protein YtjA (UPF0391 family)
MLISGTKIAKVLQKLSFFIFVVLQVISVIADAICGKSPKI